MFGIVVTDMDSFCADCYHVVCLSVWLSRFLHIDTLLSTKGVGVGS